MNSDRRPPMFTLSEQAPQRRQFLIHHNFRWLWTAHTISTLGSHITSSGLPLLAVLVLGATPLQMGLLALLEGIPILLISLPAGALVDRIPYRPLLIFADLGRALLILSVPAAAVLGFLHIEQVYAVIVSAGMLTAIFTITRQSFLPTLLPGEQLVEGNSKLEVSAALTEIVGPTAAGILVQTITAPIAMLFDALSFLASALCISLIHSSEPTPRTSTPHAYSWHEMWAGIHFIYKSPLLRALVLCTVTRTFFGGTFAALYTLYTVHTLKLPPVIYGVLVTAGGMGALLGALVTTRLARSFTLGQMLLGAMLLDGSMALLTPLASGPALLTIGLLLFGQFYGDIGYVIATINEISIRQQLVPAKLLGRVNASVQFLVGGTGPIGALLAGMGSSFIGIRTTLFLGAGGILLATLWLGIVPKGHLTTSPLGEGQ